ncbi:MAG: ABC transporter ATP-binding protein [Spirochaetes bacterium RBG_16_49_21]|nr:MAG: ABC transporter ATP-binding protein [Spirochaetes bacterium RBG_16_49_21]
MLLELTEIHTFYGLSHILFGVSLEVAQGETVCLLGRNGVGKTTTLRSIMGLTPPRSGSINIFGKDIKDKQPFEIARMGVGLVPEDRLIFPDLTVGENLEIAMKEKNNVRGWTFEKIYKLFSVLKERNRQLGGTLSGGEQQMLAIARTLMGNPRLLLLDEPSAGLSPIMVQAVEDHIHLLKKEGMTILLTEQNSHSALKVSDRAYILEKGRVVWQGKASVLKKNPVIMKNYLGV